MSPVGMPTVLGRHQLKTPANEFTVGHSSLSKRSLVAMPTVLGKLRFESPHSLHLAVTTHNSILGHVSVTGFLCSLNSRIRKNKGTALKWRSLIGCFAYINNTKLRKKFHSCFRNTIFRNTMTISENYLQ